MLSFKRIAASGAIQKTIGVLAAEYLRFVWLTNRSVLEPADIYERMAPQLPVIIAMWHGQHFLVPFIRKNYSAKVLISRHRDGEMNAVAAERLGVGAIRGSGDAGGRFDVKGGVGAFQAMLTALAEGSSVALTADVPKVARIAGIGIIKLAQLSGRPILPVAMASSRRKVLDNWDRTAVNFPFGRIGIVGGDTVAVPADADDARLELCRQAVERILNAVTARAYALADGKPGAERGD